MIDNTLKKIYANHTGKVSDKWSIYLDEYDRIFNEYRQKALNMLEVGVQNGGSLEIWAKYFHNGQHFVGSDINPECSKLIFDDARINVVIGDVNSDKTQKDIKSIVSSFDIIIDDGSHTSSDIVRTFAKYFPLLNDGGLFVVEDLHCSYWEEFEGGLFDPYSSLAFFRKLTDIISHEHWGVPRKRSHILTRFFSKYCIDIDEKVLQHIHSIEFVNSICVIRKMPPTSNVLGQRFVAGINDVVTNENKIFQNIDNVTPNQSANAWSICFPPEESADHNLIKINHLDERLILQNSTIMTLQQTIMTMQQTIMTLQLGNSSFGSVIGRAIDKFCVLLAPMGSRKRRILDLQIIFVRTIKSNGVNYALNRALRYVKTRLISKTPNFKFGSVVVADHPQLAHWIDKNEPNLEQLLLQKVLGEQFVFTPMISVIIPVYKLPPDVLEETILSLENQTYQNWQACIVWADTEDLDGWNWLKDRTSKDPRFNIKLLSNNGGISLNSDEALNLASGEFIALLDHDDTLTPWAFYEVVKLLQSSPNLDFIYSDKDSIRADGQVRMNALFKPSWSPEMLHSVNYLTHLNVIRTELVREVGGWRAETDGAQDWDLFFRITEKTNKVARISSILYHWRILPTSTASGIHTKPYAALAQLKTQQDYFIRRGLPATVLPCNDGLFKVCWHVHQKSIDVIVFQTGTYEQLCANVNELITCKNSIIRQIYVVNSRFESEKVHLDNPLWCNCVQVFKNNTVSWSTAIDTAITFGKSETIILLDGGALRFSENIVEELAGWVAEHPDIAWVSSLIMGKDDIVFEAGRVFSKNGQTAPLFCDERLDSYGWFGGPLWYRNISACSPYAVSMKRVDAIRAFIQISGEITFGEFCQQLTKEGRRGLINPFAKIYFEHAPEKDWINYASIYHSDPYFSPVFTQVSPLRLQS